MPNSTQPSTNQLLPSAETAFSELTVDELKWYAALLLRLPVTRKAEKMLPNHDLLTELANTAGLRTLVHLATIGATTVLLIPEEHETVARRQLRKVGYVPRKG